MNSSKKLAFLFICFIFTITACQKDEENDSNSNNNNIITTVDSPLQIKATIDGNPYHYQYTPTNGINNIVSSSIAFSPDSSFGDYSSGIYDMLTDKSIFGITKGTITYYPGQSQDSVFLSFFEEGNYSFSKNAEDGFAITWYDEDGTVWSTSNGSGNQNNSSISIDEMKDTSDIFGTSLNLKATFSCTLYDEEGNSKQLTNGTFVGRFEKI